MFSTKLDMQPKKSFGWKQMAIHLALFWAFTYSCQASRVGRIWPTNLGFLQAASCLAIAPAPGTPKLPGFLGKRLLGCSRGSTWLLHCSGLAGRSSWSLHGFAFASAFPFAFSFALLVPIGIYLQLVHSLLLIFFQIWNHRLIIVSWFCRSLILEDWKCLLWDCRWCF